MRRSLGLFSKRNQIWLQTKKHPLPKQHKSVVNEENNGFLEKLQFYYQTLAEALKNELLKALKQYSRLKSTTEHARISAILKFLRNFTASKKKCLAIKKAEILSELQSCQSALYTRNRLLLESDIRCHMSVVNENQNKCACPNVSYAGICTDPKILLYISERQLPNRKIIRKATSDQSMKDSVNNTASICNNKLIHMGSKNKRNSVKKYGIRKISDRFVYQNDWMDYIRLKTGWKGLLTKSKQFSNLLDTQTVHSNRYDPKERIWYGAEDLKFYDKNISVGEIIFEEMRKHPKNIAQISDSEKTILTKEDLLLNSVRIATFFRNSCISQDDVIAFVGRNTTHMSALAYACFFNGTAIHALNPSYEEETCRTMLSITKPKMVFCDAQDYEKIKNASKDLSTAIYVMNKTPNEKLPSIYDILKTPYDKKFRPLKLKSGINQNLAILCTSGTTGTPKAVIISNCHRLFSYFEVLTGQDVQYSPSTLDWLSGLVVLVTSGVFGTTCLITDKSFDPISFLRLTQEYKITWALLAPPLLAVILNCSELTADKMDSIKYLLYGGSTASVELQKQFKRYVRNAVCQYGYACTEIGHMVCTNLDVHKNDKTGSVGTPTPGVKFKIIDENGKSMEPKEIGEICCHNEEYWAGYYNNQEETDLVKDATGWIHTGDIGYFDEDNYLFIVDRKKDMLKYMNIMYYPNDIERVIQKMPDVLEVCVFGVTKEAEGDAAAAAVVKQKNSNITEKDVIEFVKQNITAKYKQLNAGAVIVKELKKLPNGKLNRRMIKDECLDKLKR